MLKKASKALGHHIEIISGQEEARLIYLGVSHSLPYEDERRLAVDIGGGSTEIIIGEGFESKRVASLFMGCVSYTRQFFPDDTITQDGMKAAETAARVELEAVEDRFKNLGWERAYGASGTILAVHTVIRENGWGQAITKKGLTKVSKALVEAGKVGKLSLPGLTPERAPVFAGGVAILRSVFDGLDVDVLERSNGALREGVLYDLIGRNRHEDTRERTIQRLVEQYRIDTAQADRVERTALLALTQLKKSVEPRGPRAPAPHHVGRAAPRDRHHDLSYSGYQRHGAYIVANGELPGFSRDDQALLAALISAHRRKLNRIAFQDLMVDEETALRLAILIRVAVLLNRHRSPRALPPVAAAGAKKSLSIAFPEDWLDEHPLTHADLEAEAKVLKKVGYDLVVS